MPPVPERCSVSSLRRRRLPRPTVWISAERLWAPGWSGPCRMATAVGEQDATRSRAAAAAVSIEIASRTAAEMSFPPLANVRSLERLLHRSSRPRSVERRKPDLPPANDWNPTAARSWADASRRRTPLPLDALSGRVVLRHRPGAVDEEATSIPVVLPAPAPSRKGVLSEDCCRGRAGGPARRRPRSA